jgi:hypothetical protein
MATTFRFRTLAGPRHAGQDLPDEQQLIAVESAPPRAIAAVAAPARARPLAEVPEERRAQTPVESA